MKTIQVRRTRHAGHCWRSRDELISDVLLWTPTYGRAKAGRPARTYIQQLCEDTGCSPEDLPEAMNDREKWREKVRDIHASGTTWWWYLKPLDCVQTNDLIWVSITLQYLKPFNCANKWALACFKIVTTYLQIIEYMYKLDLALYNLEDLGHWPNE